MNRFMVGRILGWGFLVIVVGLVIWGIVSAANKPVSADEPSGNTNTGQVAPQTNSEVPEKQEAVSAPVQDAVLDGLKPIKKDSGVKVFTSVSRSDAFEPIWPEGTNQTAVGYSNPEEYVDGRTFWTRNPVTEDEILVFVAQCVQVNGGDKICQSDNAGAIVGFVAAGPDGEWPITLWDAELKTLIIPGGESAWQAFVKELAEFISSNKGGASVEVLGPAK